MQLQDKPIAAIAACPSAPRPRQPAFILLNRSRQRPSMLAYVRLSITSFRSVNVLHQRKQTKLERMLGLSRAGR